ncbi:LytR/AlgR family response regulator transcription factor [Actomonas aquatica]|uniref:LytTR family DNA-binding domain-containing protein n=1 Tax=Actomonas aquatica TaxID=2866162 RepID=A0ABZ1CD53_9BACT|nr:LytTR family DNA-binding domain-containing protein [Opitutus sp. WL0086]WRQ89606.1 LytTR family DNA-binding domain-containing protein [Opitutus sp. WL0086]
MKVLIADDEAPARQRLRSLLAAEPNLEIVAECADGTATLEQALALRPDLIFLDIAMPGMDGIQVLEELNRVWSPRVVFTTAHAEPAVAAFELEAADYLLKPYSRARLTAALARVRRLVPAPSLDSTPPFADPDADPAADTLVTSPPATSPERLLVKSGSRYHVVETADILSVQAAANYVVLHTTSGKHIMRSTLRQLEADLCPRRFYRTSRSTIANLHAVREVKTSSSGTHAIILSDGSDLPLTSGLRELEHRLRHLS